MPVPWTESSARALPVVLARLLLAALLVIQVNGCAGPWVRSPGARLTDLPRDTWSRIAARGAEFPAELADPVWIQATAHETDEADAYRWRHVGMETVASWPAEDRPDLRLALYSTDPAIVANAAIMLARSGNPRAAGRLMDVVEDPSLEIQQRLAACETLGSVEYEWVGGQIDRLLDQHSGDDQPNGQLRAELLRAAARHPRYVDPRHFSAALQSRDANVRLAAVESWPAVGDGHSPDEVSRLIADDPDRQVRAAAVLTAAGLGADFDVVATALADYDLEVRLAAVEALGTLGGSEAIARLNDLLKSAPDRTRGHMVRALTAAGATDRVLALADDESWQVRLAVAEALKRPPIVNRPQREATNVAREFLTDRSAQVQWATVDAISAWPLADAGPLLLTAIEKSGYRVRKAAADQLAALWEPARGYAGGRFPTDAPDQRRAEALERLRQQWATEHGILDHAAMAAGAASQQDHESHVSQDQVRQVVQWIDRVAAARTAADQQQALAALARFEGDLPAALSAARRQGTKIPDVVYRDVLPARDPIFGAISRLTSPEVLQRRAAADELVSLAGQRNWSRLALARLADVVLAEPDALVWRGVLSAVAAQGGPESNLIAYAAVGHRSPDVRRRACEHLANHPDRRHETVLAPALADEQAQVAAAAAGALAQQPGLADPGPLERLLATRNPTVRLEAARALARHGHESGRAALVRMAHDRDPAVRLQVAQIAGELGEASLIGSLITMLDDRQGVRLSALEALPRVVGHDPTEQVGASPTTIERISGWKEWYATTLASPDVTH